ncbi:hypothetical protein ABT167_28485 [Streptomyces sp. NPDC001792]|uniref:hypothetical protein n=1 Tax=Streptomyces sp. NPDC001792 TaxID=3154524 RepID=UPI0033343B57
MLALCRPAGHTAVAGAFLAFGTLGSVVLDYGIPLALITTLKRGPSLRRRSPYSPESG